MDRIGNKMTVNDNIDENTPLDEGEIIRLDMAEYAARLSTDVPQVKTVMLAPSGAGKTTLLHAITQSVQGGFFIRSHDPLLGQQLHENWLHIIAQSNERQWPPGTAAVHHYPMTLNYGFDELAGFLWTDIVGGMVQQYHNEDLETIITEADSLIIGVPATLVGQKGALVAARGGFTNIINYIDMLVRKFREQNKSLPPVAIIITKSDLATPGENETIEEMSDVFIKQHFSPLFVENQDARVLITNVTLGKDLHEDGMQGEIEPENVSIPLYFMIEAHFEQNIDDSADKGLAGWVSNLTGWGRKSQEEQDKIAGRIQAGRQKIQQEIREHGRYYVGGSLQSFERLGATKRNDNV